VLDVRDHGAFAAVVLADRHAGLARRVISELPHDLRPVEPWQEELLHQAIVERGEPNDLTEAFESALVSVWKAFLRPFG
jgi:hypothetical protein